MITYELEDYIIDSLKVSEGQTIPTATALSSSYLLLDRDEMDKLVSIFEPYRKSIEHWIANYVSPKKLERFIPDEIWNRAGSYLSGLNPPRIRTK